MQALVSRGLFTKFESGTAALLTCTDRAMHAPMNAANFEKGLPVTLIQFSRFTDFVQRWHASGISSATVHLVGTESSANTEAPKVNTVPTARKIASK